MLKFLHVADLHLGQKVTRFGKETARKVYEARFQGLENVLAAVRQNSGKSADGDSSRPNQPCQFVVIAGDLFDDGQVDLVMADRVHRLLSSSPVPVFVIPGNHDPYEPGSVWHAEPWSKSIVDSQALKVGPGDIRTFVQREAVDWDLGQGIRVQILPCPVYRKTSFEDPTAWIEQALHTQPRSGYRLVIAHGSVQDRPNLPADDHPISPTAWRELPVDYIALGHWHNPLNYHDDSRSVRMAYPGVHEPMRFARSSDAGGWKPYTRGDDSLFADNGNGAGLVVTIAAPGGAVETESVRVGQFDWLEWDRTVSSAADVDRLIEEVAAVPEEGRTLLRLVVRGSLGIADSVRLADLDSLLSRFVHGELRRDELTILPTDEELKSLLGTGIVRQVNEKLCELESSTNTGEAQLARRARELLYETVRSLR